MSKGTIVLLSIGVGICSIGCSSVAEDIGRKVDPGYNEYLRNRTLDQKREDERKQDALEKDYNAKKNNDEAMKQFNARVKLKASDQNDTIKDSAGLLINK